MARVECLLFGMTMFRRPFG